MTYDNPLLTNSDILDAIDRLTNVNAALLAALEWMHPKPGYWRTPGDEKSAEFDRIIANSKGQT